MLLLQLIKDKKFSDMTFLLFNITAKIFLQIIKLGFCSRRCEGRCNTSNNQHPVHRRLQNLMCIGRFSDLPLFLAPSPSSKMKSGIVLKTFSGITAAGTVADFHDIPFLFLT